MTKVIYTLCLTYLNWDTVLSLCKFEISDRASVVLTITKNRFFSPILRISRCFLCEILAIATQKAF